MSKRCKICGRALTTDEMMIGHETCTDCAKGASLAKVWESANSIDWTEKMSDTQMKLVDVLDGMKNLLLYKNKKYGDSAINPKKIFYKGDSTNSILIRLDDKIGRVMSNPDDKPRVNDVADIIGYCTLLLVSMGVTAEDLKKFMD